MNEEQCKKAFRDLIAQELWVKGKWEEYDSLCDCAMDRRLEKWCKQRYSALEKQGRGLAVERSRLEGLCLDNEWDFMDDFFNAGGLDSCTEL